MKIEKIEAFLMSDELDIPFYFSQFEYRQRKICVVKVTTDEGIIGWGEGYGPGSVVKTGIEHVSGWVIGKDPLQQENIWEEVYRHISDYSRKGIFLSALSAIDIALWDIKGKILHQPVSVLLGGRKREKVRVYATGLYFTQGGNMPEKLAEEAMGYKEQGFSALKMKVGLGLAADTENVRSVRTAIGTDMELMIDANHAFDMREARQLIERVGDLNIGWFEEPLSNEDYAGYAELTRWSSVPITAGECEYLKFGALEMLSRRCVDIFQPDTGACGGISEVKKMMAIAEAHSTNITPHTWGTGIAIAANLHLVSNLNMMPGRLFQKEPLMEFDRSPNRLREELLTKCFTAVDGYLDVPKGDGLGIEIDEDKLSWFIKRAICLLIFALSCFSSAFAQLGIAYQDQNGVRKFYGIDQSVLVPEQWDARWIWRRGEIYASNVMLTARKTFDLPSVPQSSRLFITADAHYSLWVNGEFIGRGPARSAPHHQSYDILDISSKLKPGKNVLAVKVHHAGSTITFNATMVKPRPGLLFQLELGEGAGKTTIISDQTVKVRNEAGWDTETPQVDGSNLARVENFSFLQSIPGWELPDYDDSAWENAVLLRQEWWPPRRPNEEDFATMEPWNKLVPRDLPYLEEQVRPVSKVFEIGEAAEFSLAGRSESQHIPLLGVVQHQVSPLKHVKIDNLDGFLNQQGDLRILNYTPKTLYENEPFRNAWIVFDMGELLLGYPNLEIDAPRGTNVDVMYAANLIDGKFNPAILPDNYGDRVVLSGGKIRWEAQELRTFRYLGFYISNADKPVRISFAGVKQTWYPFQKHADMKLGDDMLNKLVKASEKTLSIITHDAFTDNPRERRQYIQTGWYAALGAYALHGDPYLMRRLLVQIADDQLQNDFLPMHAPGKPKAGILEADLHWHMGLYDYFMYTGDEATTRKLLVNLRRNLTALEELQNKDGVLDSPPHPYWIDHTDLDRRGINFTLNAWYALALEKDARLFSLLGDKQASDKNMAQARRIKQYLKTAFWVPEKGLFAENIVKGKVSSTFDEISNGLALILGIADRSQAKSIAEKLKNNDQTLEMVRPTVLMYWPIEGLFSAGYGDVAIGLLKSRFKVMMAHQEGTLWEGWNLYTFNQNGRISAKSRSAAQAEQVFHPDVFKRHLLGVEIAQPGSKELKISFTGYNPNSMRGSVPTPYGEVTINWTLSDLDKLLVVRSPRNVKISLNRSSFPPGLKVSQSKY